ncbi:MAG: hypothetical protein HY914_18375 [Desulfomonile tiedjei]|nr:hypothetical protein [Desulfomonile tiedjei]
MRRACSGICCLIVCCILSACGYKTVPRPSAATVPGEIGLVDVHCYPDRVVLKWETPLSNTDGSALKDVSGFKVYRADQKTGEECDDCPHEKKMRANIDYQAPTNAIINGREVTYVDKAVSIGNTYTYSVTVYNFRAREGAPSPDVTVVLDEPPAAPTGLREEPFAAGVNLQWNAPSSPAGIRGYRVYRAESDKADEMKAIGGTKWAETSFTDKDVQQGKTYYYQVRSLRISRGIPLESYPSQTVKAVITRLAFPAPENVDTAPVDDGIRVIWDPVKVPGTAIRYNVYRSESGGIFSRANREPLEGAPFVDRDVTRGKTYRYAVTAFPEGKPDEESSRTASEAVKFGP